MSFNIEELINRIPCDEIELIAGKEGIEKTVKYFSCLNDEGIIDEEKTGGLFFISDNILEWEPERQKQLLLKVDDIQGAGLIIDIGNKIDCLPDEMIDNGNEYKVPLLIINESSSSFDILPKIANMIITIQDDAIKRLEKAHKELTKVVLIGGSIDLLTQTMYRIFSLPVLVQDNREKIITQIGNLKENKIIQRNIDIDRSYIIEEFTSTREPVRFKLNESYSKIVCPIISGSKIYGFISIFESEDSKLNMIDYQIIEYTASLIGLEMLKEKQEKVIQKKLESEIINNLLKDKYYSKKDIIEKAGIIGWNLERDYIVLIIKIEDIDIINSLNDSDKKSENRKKHLKRTVNWELNMLNIDKILVYKGNNLIVFFYQDIRADQNIKDVALNLAKRLKDKIDIDISIGIGGFHQGLEGLRKGYNQARAALKVGKLISTGNSILHYDELGIFKLLSKLKDDPDLFNYYHETLGPLLEPEEEELLKTLKAILNNFGNKTKAAEELYIHRNSLAYRIEKIDEMLNIDLQDNENWLHLFLAVKIHELLSNN